MTTTSRRFKLVIAYDGGPYAGWQSQAGGNTVQDKLEAAILSVSGETTRVHGSGRTDTGVHALGQCAHIDLAAERFRPAALQKALNSVLPRSIRIVRCLRVPATFHARFSARRKTYRYRIWNSPVLTPFEIGRVWHLTKPLNLPAMKTALGKFKGRHDFGSFSANPGKVRGDTIRTISRVHLTRKGSSLAIEIEGDGFLYKMVRMITGALLLHNEGKLALAEIGRELEKAPGKAQRLVAPAEGLYLVRVRY